MKVNEEKLKKDLEEMYRYTFKESRKRHLQFDTEEKTEEQEEYENEIYLAGKYSGENEAVHAIMLELYGGEYCYELWMSLLAECDREDEQRAKKRA